MSCVATGIEGRPQVMANLWLLEEIEDRSCQVIY